MQTPTRLFPTTLRTGPPLVPIRALDAQGNTLWHFDSISDAVAAGFDKGCIYKVIDTPKPYRTMFWTRA